MKKILYTLAITMALVFTGMQSINAQTKVKVTFEVCYDECTTQEDCVYRAYYSIDDACGGLTHLSDGYEQISCEQTPPYEIPIICDGCTDETHNPCYRVAILLRKICIGPGGSHVICEGSDIEFYPCYELINTVTMPITWN
jgi:hypothetical protein